MASSKGYSAGRVYLQVVPSYDGFMKKLREDTPALAKAFEDDLRKVFDGAGKDSGKTLGENMSKAVADNVKVDDAWTKSLKKSLGSAEKAIGDSSETMRGHIKELSDELEAGNVNADTFNLKVQALGNELRKMANEPGVNPQLARNYEEAGRAMLGAKEASARTAAETRRAADESKKAAAAEKDRAAAHRKASRDTNVAAKAAFGLSRALSGAKSDSQDGANAFRFFNFAILGLAALGPSVIPVLAALGGGIAALGPLALGVGAGLGVFALALSGVGDAVKALQANEDAAKTGNSGYARAVQNAARAVADARRSLADAYRDSAEGVDSALESQRDAERRLADAMKDSRKAQQDLTAARKEAKQELADLNMQIAQNNLDERQGVLDLFDAYNNYGAVMSDSGSTNLEREEASIALEQAQLNLAKVRAEQKKLAAEKANGDKKGVEGSEKVKDAQEGVTDAIEREKEARRDLGKAAKDVDKARADGARRVADAQRALSRALEDQKYAAQDTSAAATQLQTAMDKLSPAGQRFAKFIQSLKGGFRDIRDIAQTNMLPGLEEGMRNVMDKYGPGFKTFIGEMSTLLGDLSADVGEAFANENFARFFKTMSTASLQFTDDASKGTMGFLEGLAGFFDVATPTALKLSGYIRDVGIRFGEWANSEEGREKLRKFFAYVEKVGPKVKDFFISVAKALGNVAEALAPIGESVLSYLTDFFEYVATIDPDILRPIVIGLLGLIIALQSAAGIMAVISVTATILSAPMLILVAAVAAIAAAFFFLSRSGEENSKTFQKFMDKMEPFIVIVKDIAGLIRDRLVKTFKEDLLPAVKDIAAYFTDEFIPALAEFYPTIRPIVKFLVYVFGELLGMVIEGLKNIVIGVMKVIQGFMKVISGIIAIFQGDFRKGFGLMWEGVKQIFMGAIQAIVGLFSVGFVGAIKGGIIKIFRAFIGLFKKDIPGLLRNFGPMMRQIFSGAFKKVGEIFTGFKDKALGVFKGLRDGMKPIFTKIKSFVNDVKDAIVNLGTKSASVAGDIAGFFKKKMGNGIRTVVDLVVNKALIGGVNKIGGWLGLGGKEKQLIAPVKLPDEFHAGGYTGPGSKYKPAGIVHADEFVIRKESRQRIEAAKPGFLDALNRDPSMAGFANGGRVYPGASSRMYPNYNNHTGIDFSYGPGGQGNPGGYPFKAASAGKIEYTGYGRGFGQAVFARGIDGLLQIYGHAASLVAHAGQKVSAGQKLGIIGSTGNSSGNHLHFEIAPGDTVKPSNRNATIAWLKGAKNIGGGKAVKEESKAEKLFSKIGSAGKSALLKPANFFKNRVSGAFDKVDGVQGDMLSVLKKVPGKVIGDIVGKVKKMATGKLGKGWDAVFGNKVDDIVDDIERKKKKAGHGKGRGGQGGGFRIPETKLYDNGGWLPPGHSSVYNATGRPEPVFNPEQWDKIKDGKQGGDNIFNLKAYGAEPKEVAAQLASGVSREQRRIRRSGTTGRRGAP
jgi:murein DD-endopeptidase MepM/ murein hydrolase activator NlpD/phage-related protein